MENPRQRRPLTHFIVIIAILVLLYLLNNLGSRKSAEEQVSELVSQHKGAIVFLESGTEADRPFREALKEIRAELKGSAGMVVVKKEKKEGSRPPLAPADSLPALIIIDSHGNEVRRFVSSLDRKVLDELVRELATHHH